MATLCKRIAESETFQSFILALILVTAGCMGLETFPDFVERYDRLLVFFYYVSQAIFIFEIVVRIVSYTPDIRKFFGERWNTFDFVIVVASCLPAIGSFALVVRLLRVLRVLRVISVSDRLRGFISRLGESMDEAFYSAIMLAVLGYIFAIAGYSAFGEADPAHWGTLLRAGLTIFYLLLLQDVPSIVAPALAYSGSSILFFIIFYLTVFSMVLAVLNAAITQSTHDDDEAGRG